MTQSPHFRSSAYWIVYGTLLVLTAVTVYLKEIHLPLMIAVGGALLIASIKGSLVASWFMHLKSEPRIIFGLIALTGVLFFFLLLLPVVTDLESYRQTKQSKGMWGRFTNTGMKAGDSNVP